MYWDVLLPISFSKNPLTYQGSPKLKVGNFVRVRVRQKPMTGVIWQPAQPGGTFVSRSGLKSIEAVLPDISMTDAYRSFLEWVSSYTMTPLPQLIGASLPNLRAFEQDELRSEQKKVQNNEQQVSRRTLSLSAQQQAASDVLRGIVREKSFGVCFLSGVTGSGKTEVYFESIEETCALHDQSQALVLLPEISLTHQMLERFHRRFPDLRIVSWHSSLNPSRRAQLWREIAQGRVDIVVGARSALFLPFSHLKIIVVDEEHDASFKQEEGFLYHARDMAVVRAKIEDHPIILSSATPSLETFTNARSGKYRRVDLPQRYGVVGMPQSVCIDMRRETLQSGSFLSPTLLEHVEETLRRGKQAMLFINRRGWAPLTVCKACGLRLSCRYCTTWLVEHRRRACFLCHYCGYKIEKTGECPACRARESLVSCGPGIERVEQEVRSHFPKRGIVTLSSDTGGRKKYKEALDLIQEGATDIVVGTQIISKGLHFSRLHCVGIVDADASLSVEDFRAPERCFQLLQQVAGRAGREGERGLVLLQTYNPQHEIIQALLTQSIPDFLSTQASRRRALNLPPFAQMAGIILSSSNENRVADLAKQMAKSIPHHAGVSVLGPVPALLSRLRGKFRWRFLVRAPLNTHIQGFIQQWMNPLDEVPNQVSITIDINPYSFF